MFGIKTKKKLNELQEQIRELSNIIKTNEFPRLREIESMHKKDTDNLNNTAHLLKVDKAIYYIDQDTGEECVRINYSITPIVLRFDADGKLIANEKFRSINELNLISFSDMDEISKQIEKVKKNVK